MKNFLLALFVLFSALPLSAEIGDTTEIVFRPLTLESAAVSASVNSRFFGREGSERVFFYTGTMKGTRGLTVFLLGPKKWDVIEGSILVHETKLYTTANDSSYLYRLPELMHSIKSADYRIEMCMMRKYSSGPLFDFFKKKFPALKLVVFPADSVSVWYLVPGGPAGALERNY